jgi:hypothetical protein
MPCYTITRRRQSLTQRKLEVRNVVARVGAGLAAGTIKARVGPQGAVAFTGDFVRDDVTDVCIYRQLMATGSSAAKAALARAEALAGRSVSREALAQGAHSHDGGATWHESKG